MIAYAGGVILVIFFDPKIFIKSEIILFLKRSASCYFFLSGRVNLFISSLAIASLTIM